MLQRSQAVAEHQGAPAPVTQTPCHDPALLHLPSRPDGYVPIADYGVIGDTRTMALVARDGSIDWLCLPNVDDAPILGALLDRNRGGHFFIGVSGPCQVERRYAGGSAVLVTRTTTADGVVEITDFMPLDLRGASGPIEPARRLIRIAEAIEGGPEICVHFAPTLAYGETTPELRRAGSSSFVFADGNDFLLLQSELPLAPATRGVLVGKARLQAGEKRRFTLSFCRGGPGIIPPGGDAPDREFEETQAFWREFCARIDYDGPFRSAVLRSLVTLRLLSFSQSGAVVAAATMALPEAIGGRRNWDYRFCWLRDSYFVLNSFMDLGLAEEGAAFFRWLMHATQLTAPRLNTLYTVFGRTDTAAPHQVKSLEGYRRSGPVHRGNDAVKQFQLDAYGAVLVCALILAEHGGDIGRAEQRRLRGFADATRQDWTLPDNGLWEMRGPRRHHTYSKLMCWAALDAMVRLCERGAVDADAADYAGDRDLIRDTILRQAWNAERGAFTGAFGHDYLDASLLLMPRLGFLPAHDPRMVSTFDAVEHSLGRGAQLRRYRPGLDGFDSTEGTFTACGFWAADYLARRGDVAAARRRIADLLAHANDLGLMAEELDPDRGEQLGNFPQALSHTAFIEAALALQEAERNAATAAP
jgi:GH15 family glucan-1,4-alpha-glucosidase